MPRRKRLQGQTEFYHWINRGINQEKLFHKTLDFERFLSLIKEHSRQFEIKLFHYCLMSNHAHLLISSNDLESMAKFSQYIQRRYAYYYCKTYKWRGQVFQRMYRSIPIEKDSYLLECGRYIERNPVRANIVKLPEEYPYSSYCFYAFGKKGDILELSPAYLGISDNPKIRQGEYRAYVGQDRLYEKIVDEAILKK